MLSPGLALRARLFCVLTVSASAAACSPPKEGATPEAPGTQSPKAGPPPSVAEGEPPRPAPTPAPTSTATVAQPGPTEVLTSGPAPAPAPPPVPGKCEKPTNRCFPPRSEMRGAMVQVDLSTLPFDANGCLPQANVGGSCLGFRPTSGPKVKGGQCCYDGCSSQPAPCGRPLLLDETPLVAPLVSGFASLAWV